MSVSLNYSMVLRVKIIQTPTQEDASALASRFRLRNESLVASSVLAILSHYSVKLITEVAPLCRQQPRLGEELVLFWEEFLHSL